MKQANHNAVDLLLRSLARGREEPRVGEGARVKPVSEGAAVSDHLDADELNLYAEGVLPAPARSRYTEHLSDCQRCRQLVVGLAQAAGRTVQSKTTTQPAGTSFWQSLTTMFSLPVLRYALPAVLLTGVIVIGFVALREQRRPDLIAKNQQAEPAVAVDQLSENAGNAPASAAPSSVLPDRQSCRKRIRRTIRLIAVACSLKHRHRNLTGSQRTVPPRKRHRNPLQLEGSRRRCPSMRRNPPPHLRRLRCPPRWTPNQLRARKNTSSEKLQSAIRMSSSFCRRTTRPVMGRRGAARCPAGAGVMRM